MVIAYNMVQRGIERGIERGRDEAYEDANRQAADYYKRMLEAREKGEDFDEPPPRFGRNGR